MSSAVPQELLVTHIANAIRLAVDDVAKKVIDEALDKIERDLRERVGGIAAQVVSQLSYERMGTDVVIRVKFG